MRVVIDIPEEDYEKIIRAHWFEGHDTILDRVYLAIKQGKRLPESHGRLIDADAVEEITWKEPVYTDIYNVLTDVREKIRELPAIIEKGGEQE